MSSNLNLRECPNCHYKQQSEFSKDFCGYISIVGDEEFFDIYTEHKITTDNPIPCEHGDYNYQNKITIELVACPKCKVVFMER